jgi:hypothetical protein
VVHHDDLYPLSAADGNIDLKYEVDEDKIDNTLLNVSLPGRLSDESNEM